MREKSYMYATYRYPSTTLHGAITYKIAMGIFTIMKTSNHTNSSSIHLCRHCIVTLVQSVQYKLVMPYRSVLYITDTTEWTSVMGFPVNLVDQT